MTRDELDYERLEELIGNALARLDELERLSYLRAAGLMLNRRKLAAIETRVADLEFMTNPRPADVGPRARGERQERNIGRSTHPSKGGRHVPVRQVGS